MSEAFILILIVSGLYFLMLLWLGTGFLRTPFFRTLPINNVPLTIIICARNEEKNIVRCIHSIYSQEYDRSLMEIIFINDASEDNTLPQAETALLNSGLKCKVINNSSRLGKKRSITEAMTKVTSELVIMRDADTFTSSTRWLSSMVSFHLSTKSDFIIAPVGIADNEDLLWALQAIENNVLAVLGCGSAFYKIPFLCNGANMAFTKKCFESVNGFNAHIEIPSGDDVLFLEAVRKKKELRIGYLKGKEAIVYTYPCYSFSDLIKQKTRWASKVKFSGNALNITMAVLVFLVNLLWIFSLVYINYDHDFRLTGLLFIFSKLTIDILLLFLSSMLLKNIKLFWMALPAACIYPLYALVVSVASIFYKPSWK
jgi:poly-beta-1,6-N-acetyl-D-glucosamine synthase